MESKNMNYRSKTNRLYETVVSKGLRPVYVVKHRKFLTVPLAILCAILAAFSTLMAVALNFDAFITVIALIFVLLTVIVITTLARNKVKIDSNGITYTSLFKTTRFVYDDVEKYVAETIKQVITYYTFIKIPAGTERTFKFYLKGRKLPVGIPLVYDSRSVRFVEDRLIEKELIELDALLRDEYKTSEWKNTFLMSLKDVKNVPDPSLFGLRHLLINALYISGKNSPYYSFSDSFITMLEMHVEYWIKEGYLTNVEDNWRSEWYTKLPSDWKEQWLSCIERYVGDYTASEDLNRMSDIIRGIRGRW